MTVAPTLAEIWVRFAAGAIARPIDLAQQAQAADDMLAEFKKRFVLYSGPLNDVSWVERGKEKV